MKKIILAYNPVSGSATFKHRLDEIIAKFQERDCMILPYRTRKNNDGYFEKFVEAVQADGVIAAGGDGTLHEVVNRVVKGNYKLPIGIIGSGTSNDFAHYLGLNRDQDKYFDNIAKGVTRPVDLGKVGDEYIINVASAGAMTSIAHEVNVKLKNALGKRAYYLQAVKEIPNFKTVKLTVEADDVVYKVNAYLFVIINSGVVGSMQNVAPDAKIDDGKLDFLAVKKTNPSDVLKITADLFAGKSVAESPHVLHIQAAEFTVSCETELVGDLDGEAGPMLPLNVKTIPHAIEMYYL